MANVNEIGTPVPPPALNVGEPTAENNANHLVQLGKLTSVQAARAATRARAKGVSVVDAAVSMGFLRREELMAALSRQYSYPILHGIDEPARFSRELVVGHEPFSKAAEAIRSIRTAVGATAVAQDVRSFLINAPRRGAGASYLASNLALAFAQMSLPTLLVDANLRSPRIAKIFGLQRFIGLSDALRSRNVESPPIVSNVVEGLSILPAGQVPPNPQELLASAEFLALTNNLQSMFGIVIYDTPPGMDFADAHVVASRVGAALVVGRRHKTAFNDVSTLVQRLRGINCKVLGSVLNKF
jgi:chain length determinant protein tyrosine kinase EpsG